MLVCEPTGQGTTQTATRYVHKKERKGSFVPFCKYMSHQVMLMAYFLNTADSPEGLTEEPGDQERAGDRKSFALTSKT